MKMENNRIKWVDIAKGISILLVVVGHTVRYGNTGPIIKTMIFSFHMPLFFIMSGFTAKSSATTDVFWKKTKNLSFSLLIPAYTAYICKTLLLMPTDKPTNFDFFINHFYSLLFVDCGKANYQDYVTYSFGFIWFLTTLFLCRIVFNYLSLIFKKQQLLIVVCILSMIGYIIGIQQKHTAFAFDIALTVLPLLLLGEYMKKWNISKKPILYAICSLLIWIISFFILYPHSRNHYYLDIIERRYPLYPLCFLTATAGTICLCACCIIFSRFYISNFFALIGEHSLFFLLIHYFDFVWCSVWNSPSDQYIKTLIRLLTDIVVFFAIIAILFVVRKLNSHIKTINIKAN